MAMQWQRTKFPGVRYREHPTRKHGLHRDRYFAIRAQVDGKRREEGLGWASKGWNAQKAANVLADLKKAHILGEGPQTLQEKRSLEQGRRELEAKENERKERESVIFGDLFRNSYLPQGRVDKSPKSCRREDALFRLWIDPVIGGLPLSQVSPFDLEKIKKRMGDSGQSPRSIHYCLAVVRQTFNYSRRVGAFEGDNPVSKVKMPVGDNKRLRFLSYAEADTLLEALKVKSIHVFEMALLSLHCGLRAGEIFSLTWTDVNLQNGFLSLRDTKPGPSRIVYMTQDVKAMLNGKDRGQPDSLVFPGRGGVSIQAISKTFSRVVKDLGLNRDITDPRHKVYFHTLRHTYASWLVSQGVDLYVVQKSLGHSTLAMTQRYSHLAPDTLQRAARIFENGLNQFKNSSSVIGITNRNLNR